MTDVRHRKDIEKIVSDFYQTVLADPIIGFIFTDVAKIDLPEHVELVSDFWEDVVFARTKENKKYSGNTLQAHLQLAEKFALRAGHFTRWLYLFNQAVNQFSGPHAELMKQRADSVAKSISAALTAQKRGDMRLSL